MASERQFEAAAHADAVDRRNDRLAAGLEPSEDEVQPLRPFDEGAHRGFRALFLHPAGVVGPGGLQEREIRAADTFAKADDRALDRGVGRNPVDDLTDLGHDFGIDDVQRAAGHVPRDERDAVGVGLEAKILEVHFKSPARGVRRVR